MNTVLKIFLSMSFSGALLILVLFWGERALKDRISRQWQYYIWLIVILRLLLPLGPETSLMGKAYQTVDQVMTQSPPLWEQQNPLTAPGNAPAPVFGLTPDKEITNAPAEGSSTAHPLYDMMSLLTDHIWLIWLMAAMGMLLRKITIYQGFIRYINAGATPVSDIEILDRLSIAAEQAGVKKPIELCINPLVSSPLLTGFFHPCIVLPVADIPEKDFQYIILHELTHYRRRDIFYNWLVQVTVCLHWFNPLVHLMSREITKACEFSCDEAVLAKTGHDSAQDYGKTLLDSMAAVGKYRKNPGAVTLSENKQLLKERLGAIMLFKERSRAVKILTAVLTLCLVLGASFVGIYTRGNAAGSAPATSPDIPPDAIGRPSLWLDINSAAVNVLAATDHKISAEYNSDVYTVDIKEQDNTWKVSISCKTRRNTNDETIRLYIPDVDYGDVNLSVESGHFICGLIRSGNITGDFHMASVLLTLPEGFTGSVDATANSGYFQLVSQDDFRNTTTTITDNGDWGEIYKPEVFKENGNTSTFTDGTGNNMIQVTRKGSGVMGIYTSDAFHMNLPDEWQDEWLDSWQNEWLENPWGDDWWQNIRQEDDTHGAPDKTSTPSAADTGTAPSAPDDQTVKTNGSASEMEQYYKYDSLPLFEIAFSRLDENAQKTWLEKLYADGGSAFFAVAVNGLDADSSLINDFAEKAYDDGKAALFSILADCMDETKLELWLERALEDRKWNFQSVLFDKLERNDEFDELEDKQEKEWEEAQRAEYEAAGITMDGKNYYQGQLINIFLDIRANRSSYTLNMNPEGTINVKILRDEDNKITGVSYMTEAEVTELMGEPMGRPDDE